MAANVSAGELGDRQYLRSTDMAITKGTPLTCRDCSTTTVKVEKGRVEISVGGGVRMESVAIEPSKGGMGQSGPFGMKHPLCLQSSVAALSRGARVPPACALASTRRSLHRVRPHSPGWRVRPGPRRHPGAA
jgi:hypothetical protein